MKAKYEYKFVRLDEGWCGPKKSARDGYQQAVQEHARTGWRLVQIFCPGVGIYGMTKYYELILEREVSG
jgi:hypothetical protein